MLSPPHASDIEPGHRGGQDGAFFLSHPENPNHRRLEPTTVVRYSRVIIAGVSNGVSTIFVKEALIYLLSSSFPLSRE